MKAGWQVKKLGESCFIARGGSPRPIQDFLTNDADGVNWVKISDATASDKYIYTTKEKIKPSGISRSRFVKEGDFLLSNSMSFGRPYIMQITGCVHDGWLVLSEYEKYFDQAFLYYLLSSPLLFEQFDKLAAGSTVRNLNIELASRVDLPIPPIQEQQRIVAILDEAFEQIAIARANTEKNLQNARALFESYLHNVNAENQELGNFVSIKTGKLDANAAVEDGAYPFFTCSREIYRIDKFAFDCEAILLAGNNASGDFNVKHYIGKFNAYQRTYVITVNNENEASYRYLYFQLLAKLKEFKKQSVGSNTKFLKIGMIQGMKIPMPSLTEQKDIVVKLDGLLAETQRLESIYQRKLNALDALKKSLLHQAFAGEL